MSIYELCALLLTLCVIGNTIANFILSIWAMKFSDGCMKRFDAMMEMMTSSMEHADAALLAELNKTE